MAIWGGDLRWRVQAESAGGERRRRVLTVPIWGESEALLQAHDDVRQQVRREPLRGPSWQVGPEVGHQEREPGGDNGDSGDGASRQWQSSWWLR